MTSFVPRRGAPRGLCLNPRSCAASSMTHCRRIERQKSVVCLNPRSCAASSMTSWLSKPDKSGPQSQSAFMRGFIDDIEAGTVRESGSKSQSAFMRGFIDDPRRRSPIPRPTRSLNPRSCAASSMTSVSLAERLPDGKSQSAFMRGFIDDAAGIAGGAGQNWVSIRVHARLHR